MADGMYVGMSGAVARAVQLESVSDNLANAQTTGFTAARPAFEALLTGGGQRQLVFTAATGTGVDLRPGPAVNTGRPNDVLPESGAFLSVKTPGGETAFTRDGRLIADAQGQLTIGGNPVLSIDGRPLRTPAGLPFTIDARGVVASEGRELGQLALSRLDGPQERRGGALLVPGVGGRAVPIDGRVRTGELEQANTSALEATVQLISVQRNYDTSMQAIATYRKMDERANELGRTR